MIRSVPRVVCAPFAILLAASAAAAQPADSTGAPPVPPSINAGRATGAIRVDGRLDEADWKSAVPATHFTQLDPHEGKPASEASEVRVLVGDDAIYIGARLDDREPSAIRAHLARRDDASDSDYFEVSIDSFHDRLTAWTFQVNPAGSIRDVAVYADGNEDASWDPIWDAAARTDSLGWTAEMRIPFSQLHYNHTKDPTWGIQFIRLIHRRQETDYFAFTPKKDQGGVSRYGLLQGLGPLPEQRHLEIMPYAASRGRFRAVDSGDPFNTKHDYSGRLGLDLKYGLGPDLTLSGTVNPDFGQAEVDPAVVNLSAYETFYPEKRPFFVTDAGNFNFGAVRSQNNFGFGEVFYTRRIGRPPHISLDDGSYRYASVPDQSTIAAAAKLTGKTRSGWTIGALDAVTTAETGRYVDTSGARGSTPVEPATNSLVTRFARDLRGGDTQIGGLVMNLARRLDNHPTLDAALRSSATQAGVDWKHAWNHRDWSFDGFLLGSRVTGSAAAIAATQTSPTHYFQRPDAPHVNYDPARTSLSGYYGTVALARNNAEHWLGSVESEFMSPGYEGNDLGYMNRADRRTLTTILIYNESRPGRLFRSFYTFPFTYNAWNYGGKMITAGYALGFSGVFANYWSTEIQARLQPSTYDDALTRGGPIARTPLTRQVNFTLGSDSRQPYTISTNGRWATDDHGGGDAWGRVAISFHPSPAIQVSAGPSYEDLRDEAQYVTTQTDATAGATYGSRYVFARLRQKTASLETRLNWVFSPRVSLQLYAQPLISSASYRDFREFRAPGTFDFDVYGKDRGTISRDSSGKYTVDPDGAGPAPSFAFADPDFNFRSLRGNAVLRWEYRPGSTFYLIWQQSRSGTAATGNFDLGRDFSAMTKAPADNIFMAKITTWFGW